jgi:glutathione peroxidase-family protein
MLGHTETRYDERGVMLLVVVFIAAAIAALAALSAGRVVAESRHQRVMENESRALNEGYGRIHLAMNVVNNIAYDDQNHNLEIRNALATSADDLADAPDWLQDPAEVTHGLIGDTQVRVYRAREYVQRLQKLKGEEVTEVDPYGDSDGYFVLEALGRVGDTMRLVSALVRETEPFSSFVFFQNQHTLGISGAPRGLIHGNTNLAFYFPNGRYTDSVSSVGGFEYRAGATPVNTMLRDANPRATPIDLEDVDFTELKGKATAYVGKEGLDAEIKLYRDGKVRIAPYTPPRYELVDVEETHTILMGYEEVTRTVTEQVQVGTTTEERTRQTVVSYETETYTVELPVYEDQEVTKTRQIPIYEWQTVTKTRWIKVFVPYDTEGDPAGGTTVGDSGEGILGEYVWIEEEYKVQEQVIVGYEEETYTVVESVQVGTTTEERTREVPIYGTETYTVEVPVYETREYEVTEEVPIYKEITKTKQKWVYQPPVALGYENVFIQDYNSMIYIDGRITSLEGEVNGRLTVVGNEKVRITGDIRYVDDNGQTTMLNGNSTTEPYVRNSEYTGDSVLGVIARDDILFTWKMPDKGEVNATLMSVDGRVGADGLWIDAEGNPVKDSWSARKQLLTADEYQTELNYDKSGTYRTRPFVKDSLRRLGGLISNDRIIETFIRARNDGTAYVDAGFRRGSMRYDFNLLNNPPPNFVEIPRPVLTYFAPVFLVRDEES